MKEYTLNAYLDNSLTKIIHLAKKTNIIAIEHYIVNETCKSINIYNSSFNLLEDRLIKFQPGQDLRLNNLLPNVSLYSDFIKVSPDPLKSRIALDFLAENNIKDILTFYTDVDNTQRQYVSFAVNNAVTQIAQQYKAYQKIADYIFKTDHLDLNAIKLVKADKIKKECSKSLTNKELQVLSFLTKGMNALEISKKKFISKRTVDKHIENIRKKLNVPSTSSLIAKYAFWQNNALNYVTC
ncbi:helix-turn-helix transcriptional regulator [Francisellaceae bacterium]|nr:helix-turn-helix transcriptional regulator [Francisellaceae bacterium]